MTRWRHPGARLRGTARCVVLGGLEIELEYRLEGPDYSVGLNGYNVDEWRIVGLRQKDGKWKEAKKGCAFDWLEKKITASEKEMEHLDQQIMDEAYVA